MFTAPSVEINWIVISILIIASTLIGASAYFIVEVFHFVEMGD